MPDPTTFHEAGETLEFEAGESGGSAQPGGEAGGAAARAEPDLPAGALEIERLPIDSLAPYARNPRTHSPEQIAQIAASIREFGFTNPLLIDERSGLIAGHGRLIAADQLGMRAVPCIRLRGLSEAQKRALVIADNKLALNAGWDSALLLGELEWLNAEGFSLELTGFSLIEFESLGAHGDGEGSKPGPSLADRFMVPPFSVLNAREGWWQDRKRAWLALGIQSEVGRGGTTTMMPPTVTQNEDGSLNYEGTQNDAARFKRQKRPRANASPGGSPRPAADYSKRQRGRGDGKAL